MMCSIVLVIYKTGGLFELGLFLVKEKKHDSVTPRIPEII